MIVKIFKLFLVAFFCFQIGLLDCAEQEGNKKRKREDSEQRAWADEKFSRKKDFAQDYPALTQGFQLIGSNFQNFMMKQLKNKYSYEIIKQQDSQQISRLHQALEQAESKIVNHMSARLQSGFIRTTNHEEIETWAYEWDSDYEFKGDQDLKKNEINIFNYVKRYEDSFCGDVVKKIEQDCPYLLTSAVKQKNILIVKRLLAIGVDVNAYNREELMASPLSMAATSRSDKIVSLLLAVKNIEVDIVHETRTPLWKSVLRNESKTIKKFIAAGASRDIPYIYSHSFISQKMKDYIKKEVAKRDAFKLRESIPRSAKAKN